MLLYSLNVRMDEDDRKAHNNKDEVPPKLFDTIETDDPFDIFHPPLSSSVDSRC